MPSHKPTIAPTAALAALALLLPAPALAADQWEVVHAESVLGFATTQMGSRFEGRFAFSADMRFAADDVEGSEFDVTVDVTSASTGSRDRDQALAEPEFFWFEEFPEAYFRTTRIEHIEGDDYEAVADLTIRDVTHEVTLPFTWVEQDGEARVNGKVTATMDGGLTMEPLEWDVGTEEWVKDGSIGRETEVFVDLLLVRPES
jgi:polyisoprenoid-binding protein YceI